MGWRLDPDGDPTPIYIPEDNDFLNQLDTANSYIGTQDPQIEYSADGGRELWVVQSNGSIRRQYIPAEDLGEYNQEWGDNNPAAPEEAYA